MSAPIKDGLSEIAKTIDTKTAVVALKKKENNPLRKLVPKQRKFLLYFLKTKNRVAAWKASHPACKSDIAAYVAVGSFLKEHPDVLSWLYDMAGMGTDDIVGVVTDSMKANKSQFYLGKKYEEPDHYARLKAAELAIKMKGGGEDTKKGTGNVNIQIITDKEKGIFKIIEAEDV